MTTEIKMRLLSEYNFDFLPAIDLEKEWDFVKPVLTNHPWLRWQGYFRSERDYRSFLNRPQVASSIDDWRDESYLDQVYRARHWLGLLTPTRKINRLHSSYGLKHWCEDWWQIHGSAWRMANGGEVLSSGVSNGSLILAALSLGWNFTTIHERRDTCPNVWFPFSEKSLRLLRPEGYLF